MQDLKSFLIYLWKDCLNNSTNYNKTNNSISTQLIKHINEHYIWR